MMKENEKKLYERILYSKISLIILVVIIFLMSKAVLGLYEKKQSTDESLYLAEAELERALARTTLLENKLESFGTKKGIEMEIRDMFNVAKEGERVIVIVDDSRVNDTEKDEEISFFSKIKRVLIFWRE